MEDFKDTMTYWLSREGLHFCLIESEDVHIVVFGGSIQERLSDSGGCCEVAITCGRDNLGHRRPTVNEYHYSLIHVCCWRKVPAIEKHIQSMARTLAPEIVIIHESLVCEQFQRCWGSCVPYSVLIHKNRLTTISYEDRSRCSLVHPANNVMQFFHY